MALDHDMERSMYRHSAGVPAKDDLFTTFGDRVLRRADEVIEGRFCQFPAGDPERRFLRLLRPHQGKDQALALGAACERLRMTPRTVKEIVQNLRHDFGVQIGASRDGDAGGYYLITTQAESLESTRLMFKQAVTMLRVVARMRKGTQEIDVMLTQLGLEITAGISE